MNYVGLGELTASLAAGGRVSGWALRGGANCTASTKSTQLSATKSIQKTAYTESVQVFNCSRIAMAFADLRRANTNAQIHQYTITHTCTAQYTV